MFNQFKNNSTLIILLFTIFVVQILLIYPIPANFEDSFITYRYIQSISDFQFFSWNFDHKPVYGMTGLVFPFIAGIVNIFIKNPIISSTLLGVIFSILTILILCIQSKNRYHVLIILFLCLNPIFLLASSNGLETSLVFFILSVVFSIKVDEKNILLLSILTLISFLTRPDITIIVGLYVSIRLLQEKKILKLLSYGFLSLSLITITIFLLNKYFDSPLPLAWYIKGGDIGILEYPSWIISQFIVFPAFRTLPLLMLLLSTLIYLIKEKKVLLSKSIALILSISIFFIYQLKTLPIMNVGLRFFAPILITIVFILLEQKSSHKQVFFKILLVLSFVFSLYFYYVDIKDSHNQAEGNPDMVSIAREIAKFNNLTIASSEAGQLAYYAGYNKFFDTIGLNNTFVAKNHNSKSYSKDLYNYFNENQWPDVYIRFKDGIGAGEYAYLENVYQFNDKYTCGLYKNSLKVCILNQELSNLGFLIKN